MKSFIFMIICIFAFLTANAQTFTPKTTGGGGYDVESGVQTNANFELDGKVFPIYETSKGTKFVVAVSTKGSTYPVWIYEETTFSYEGHKVYKSKKESYCYYKMSAKGYPTPIWLNMEE